MDEFGEIETAGLPDAVIPETSHFPSQMHFDESLDSIANSDLEDGQKDGHARETKVHKQHTWPIEREV